MCGILGIIKNNNQPDEQRFRSALDLMTHRGPDGSSVLHNRHISFGHRRLSIIDLSCNADQPFVVEDGRLVIVFNGEIYNYKSISQGLQLTTTSDTEVLVKGYARDGIAFFKKIRGIYAFTIYDARDAAHPKCIMLRDPAGVKPFYYSHDENGFVFASEIKSILPLLKTRPAVNEHAIKQYIHLGYCLEPQTAYTGIYGLEPGICYTYDIHSGKITQQEEVLRYDFTPKPMDEEEAIRQTGILLDEACQRNMVADVKVNVALSGGIDSSLIYAYTNKHNNNNVTGITIAFDDKQYDESNAAMAHAKHIGAPQQIEKTDSDNKLGLLNKLLLNFDQPYADSSFIPFYFLSKAAAKHSKVLIGGDSGDEIHNGYMGYRVLPGIYKIQQYKLSWLLIPLLSLVKQVVSPSRKRVIQKAIGLLKTKNLQHLMFYWESWFPPDVNMYKKNPFNYEPASVFPEKQKMDLHGYIQKEYFRGRMQSDYLKKSDMMSMLNSLEFRVPMLDEDLTQFSLHIPYRFKSTRKSSKIILRKLHGLIFPKELTELPKKGFTIPLDSWLGEDNLRQIRSILSSPRCYYTRYISKEYADTLFESLGNSTNESYISRAGIYQRILIIYSLEIWHENYIGK